MQSSVEDMDLETKTKPPWVDLHTHSNKSDGSLSPAELIKQAISMDVSILAITDHDTLEGVREGLKFLTDNQVKEFVLLSGIEISAQFDKGNLHIVGYKVDLNHVPLLESLNKLKSIRKNRNIEIINKLAQLNITIDLNDLIKDGHTLESQGRPHIAKLLIEKKVVKTINQAFFEYIGKDKKAYVPIQQFSVDQVISLIHSAGGKAFIAHPVTLNLDEQRFERYLGKLTDYGLDGLEVYAPMHSRQQTVFFKRIAEKRNLMISAGSDFHGSYKPKIKLGICHEGNRVGLSSISGELILNR